MSFLHLYFVRYDTGFAPHVDRGGRYLTLATCKPAIRKAARKGDWVLGVAGKTLLGEKAGRVVFLGEVTEDPITFDQYFRDPRFRDRADNIYYSRGGKFRQVKGARFHTSQEEKEHDLNVNQVLVCRRFIYYGGEGPELISEGFADLAIPVRDRRKLELLKNEVRFLEYARDEWSPWNRYHIPAQGESAGRTHSRSTLPHSRV